MNGRPKSCIYKTIRRCFILAYELALTRCFRSKAEAARDESVIKRRSFAFARAAAHERPAK